MRPERFLAGTALLICTAWAIAYIDFPFGWDQGIAAWMGSIICEGGVPYRDGWDCSGPISYFIPALAQSLFGRSTHALRILDLLLLLAAAGTLYALTTRLTNRFCGTWTAVVFFLWYASGSYWHTAQRDGWAAMLTLMGVGPLLVVSRRWMVPSMFAGGIALGLAVLIKPVFGPFVLLPMVLVADQVRGREWRLAMLSVTALAVGMAIPIGATVGWFAHHGALADLMEAYLLYPQQIYAASVQQSWSSLLTEMGRALTPGKILFVMLPFAVFGARSLDTSARRPMVLLVLWSVLALAAVIVQKRFFLYHWLPIYPPLAILFGMGIYRLQCAAASDHLSLRVRRLALSAGLVVILMHVAAHPLFDLYSSAAYAAGYRSRDLYLQSFGIPADEVAAAERLAQLSTPDDYVLVWGWNTNVLYLADRKSPTRFGFSMPLLLGPGTDVRDRYRAEFMRALGNTPIKYIILGEIAETILGGKVDLSDFPEFYDYLVENFQSNGDIGRVQIWTARKRPVADETVTTR